MGAVIKGFGYSVPDNVVTNTDFEKMVDTSDEWIRERTGIIERRIAEKGSANSDFCLGAAKNALKEAGIEAVDLDGIIVGTITPDMGFPSTACFIQDKIGASKAFAFDMTAACTGFIYALSVADSMIRSKTAKYMLVCGADLLSTMINFEDRNTCVLFGDGAGAVILGPEEEGKGILASSIHSDGSLWELLYRPGGGTVHPINEETISKKLQFLQMQGNEVFKNAVTRMVSVSKEVIERAGLTIEDVDLFFPHQANIRIINAVGKRLKIENEKVYVNLSRFGNTSAGSIPIAMGEARENNIINNGNILLLSAFGGGLTWGSAVVKV